MDALKNLPPFYPGQKVVSNRTFQQLVKGVEYTVFGCYINCCGGWIVQIAELRFPSKNGGFLTKGHPLFCDNCGTTKECTGYDVYYPNRFAPVQESPFPSITAKEVIEKELVLISEN